MLQALLWALPATLLFLSATASKDVTTADGSHERESSDVRSNLVEPYEGVADVTSRSLYESYISRPTQELAQRQNSSTLLKQAQARTLSVSSFLGGEKETEDVQAADASKIEDIAPLKDHPLWKVHKYQGIDFSPVLLSTAYGPPSETYGPPPETYGPPLETYGPPLETYGPPTKTYEPPEYTYGPPAKTNTPVQTFSPSETYSPPTDTHNPPQSSGSSTHDTAAALSALDNLSGLVSLLPEDGQDISPSLSALNSLASLLPQKSNSGLSLEQLSALVSLVSLLQAKSNGAPASTYGPPKTNGAELSPISTLVKMRPTEQGLSSGSLLARLQGLLRRRPNLLNTLLSALNLLRPSDNKGASLTFVNPSTRNSLRTKSYSSNFDPKYNSAVTFTKSISERKVVPIEKFKKHVVLGKVVPKIGKSGKFSVTKSHLLPSILSKAGKLGKLGIIKRKIPLKFGVVSKPALLKFASSLGKHFPLKVHLSKFKGLKDSKVPPLGKKHLPLKTAILAAPLNVKKHIASKVGKFGKILKPVKLIVLGKLSALKSHLFSKLAKLVKIGVTKSYIPFKLLGKNAALKKHFGSKLIKLGAGAKHVKNGILAAPALAQKHVISKLKTDSKFSVIKHPKLKWVVLKKLAGIKGITGLKAGKSGLPSFKKSYFTGYAETSRKSDQIENRDNVGRNNDYF